MSAPTVIRHTKLNTKIHQVITYWEKDRTLAVYQVYEVCGDRTVIHDSKVYTTEEGAITEYLMNVV